MLCGLIALLLLSVPAEAFSDDDAIVYQDAVAQSVALHIVHGKPDGSFSPGSPITRGELAKIVWKIVCGGNGTSVAARPVKTMFTDLDGHWAKDYAYAWRDAGTLFDLSTGTFAPDAPVTGYELAESLLLLLGYDKEKSLLPDDRSLVRSVAQERGLLHGLSLDLSHIATREQAIQMVLNALGIKQVDYANILVSKGGKLVTTQQLRASEQTLMEKYFSTLAPSTETSGAAEDSFTLELQDFNGNLLTPMFGLNHIETGTKFPAHAIGLLRNNATDSGYFYLDGGGEITIEVTLDDKMFLSVGYELEDGTRVMENLGPASHYLCTIVLPATGPVSFVPIFQNRGSMEEELLDVTLGFPIHQETAGVSESDTVTVSLQMQHRVIK